MSAGEPRSEATSEGEAEESGADGACRREVTVAVVIVNRSSYDIEVFFDGYKAGRPASSFSRSTYHVPRYRLQRTVTLDILRGGLQVGGPARIPVEQVYCNDATILVGSRPEYSVFYGDKLYEPGKANEEGEEGAEEAGEEGDGTSDDGVDANGQTPG